MQTTSDPVERARLAVELEKLSQQAPEPRSELGKKLRDIGKYSQAEFADNDVLLMSALLPVMKSLREQIVTSINGKESRIHELQRQRSSLTRNASYASYATAFFLFSGLIMFLKKYLKKKRSSWSGYAGALVLLRSLLSFNLSSFKALLVRLIQPLSTGFCLLLLVF